MRTIEAVAASLMAGTIQLAMAGPFEDGLAAYDRRDYATALKLWQPLAKKGNAEAQTNVAVLYANGQGIAQDYAEAKKWYELAAKQGHAGAQYSLGQMARNGRGGPQDSAEAAKWFRLAAAQGHAQGQYNLGLALAKGDGVAKDLVEADKWISLAATRGHEGAAKARGIVEGTMTREQIGEAQRRVAAWKPGK